MAEILIASRGFGFVDAFENGVGLENAIINAAPERRVAAAGGGVVEAVEGIVATTGRIYGEVTALGITIEQEVAAIVA